MTRFRQVIASISIFLWLFFAGESACATVDIASVSIASDSSGTQTNVPITFGHVFARGDVIDTSVLGARLPDGTSLPLQVDVKATHPDGSLRHAVLTTVLANVAGNSRTAITLNSPGSNAAGAAVTTANLLSTSFDATVRLNVGGAEYAASARDLLQGGSATTWLSGPLVTEWLVSGPVESSGGTDHAHLTARFHVRAYAGLDSVRVSVTLENNWSFQDSPRNFNYDVSVTVQGRGTVLSQNNVTHYRQARWRRVFWWGSEPQVSVAHDTTAMQEMGVVPTYDPRLSISQGTLRTMESEWSGERTRLMGPGLIYTYMPGGGGRPDIAPLPRWTARYLISQDSRAKKSTLGTSEQAGSFSIHYRDRDTDLPISLDTYPNVTILGSEETFPSCGGNCDTPYTADVAHQPSLSFVPYLVTGDYFHLEELQFWANWSIFYWGNHGGSQGLMVHDQIRAQAWGLRNLGHAAFITPDDHPLKAYFLNKVANNLNWYNRNVSDNPPTALGYLLNPPYIGADGIFATWMDDFFTWTVGHLANLGFNDAAPIFNYKARFPVGRMADPDYCWIFAGTYWTSSIDRLTGQPFQTWSDFNNSVVTTWDQSFATWTLPPNMSDDKIDALLAAECNSQEMSNILGLPRGEMIGGAWSHEGYPSNLQPAVAIAAERGVPNGAVAWDVFDSRAVVPDSGNYDYNVDPQWAIVPANVDRGDPGPGLQLPVISFSGNPRTVMSGDTATLNWSSSNADSCQASGAWTGARETSGNELVGPMSSDSTFTLSCSNATGSVSANVTISVASVPVVTISASSSSIPENSNVTLTWSSENTNSCSAFGDWSGDKAVQGAESVGPLTSNAMFQLDCAGPGGETSDSVFVTVVAASPPPDGGDPPPDGGTPPPDGGDPPPDGGAPPPDGGSPPPDASDPPPSSDMPPPANTAPKLNIGSLDTWMLLFLLIIFYSRGGIRQRIGSCLQ